MEKNIEKYIEKAGILIEALPYISGYHGKIVVIKYGGSAMEDEGSRSSLLNDIVFMKMVGMKPVVVHGGGPEINAALKQANIEPKFKSGLRVTDKRTVEIVEQQLSGKVNKDIVSVFQKHNARAVGISGKDGFIIEAEKKLVNGEDIGYVGDIVKVNTKLIQLLLDSDFIPVISPVGTDKHGNTYNINADYAAVEIAGALKALKLVFLTDIDGIYRDINDKSTFVSEITPHEAQKLINSGVISGGMIPKIECCIKAVNLGVNKVHIVNGNLKHSLLLEIYTKEGIGTEMKL